MGGMTKGGGQTIGHWYKWLLHFGLWRGPIDALLEVRGGDLPAWTGQITSSGTIAIDAEELWGGEKGEGGIVGDADVMFGEADQAPSAYMAANLGPNQSGFRGRTTFLFKGGKWGAFHSYVKAAAFKGRRIFAGWQNDAGTACWYPETAAIGMVPPKSLALYFALDCSTSMATLGSNGLSRLVNMKTAMTAVLDVIGANLAALPAGALDIMIVHWGGTAGAPETGRDSITRTGVDAAAITDLKAFVATAAADYATYFPAGVLDAPDFFAGASAEARRLLFFITDGEPSVWAGAIPHEDRIDQCAAAAATLATIENLDCYGINIDLTDTQYTAYLDNTARDGVPVLESGDPGAITSAIMSAWGGFFGMNPAHVIYDSLTATDMQGEPVATINAASFEAAADKLYAEGFGLCTEYDADRETIEQFRERICTIIGASCTRSRVDGLWHLDLIRGDYVLEDLPILTDADILDFREEPALPEDATNQVYVKWFDPQRKEARTTIPATALASVREFGFRPQTFDYREIPAEFLAKRVADRELRNRQTPLKRYTLVTNRRLYARRAGTYFRLQSTRRGIADMVCLLIEIDAGTLRSGAVKIVAIQDVFGFPATSYIGTSPAPDPLDTTPEATPAQVAFEIPYFALAARLPSTELDALEETAGFVALAAQKPNVLSANFSLYTAPDGEAYADRGLGDWCPTATVSDAAAAGRGGTAVTLADGIDLDEIGVGDAVLWADASGEIGRVDAIDVTTGAATIARGCADTVPAAHADDCRVFFIGADSASDGREYLDGELVHAKALTRMPGGQLPLAAATAADVTMAQRQFRAYPPGQLLINGESYPTHFLGELTVSWADRNRLTQADQLVDTTEGPIAKEAGTSYRLRIYDEVDALIVDETTTGDSYTLGTEFSPGVSMLLMAGADASTTFTDQTGKAWTASGNAQIDTSLGYNSGLFDGNDKISTPDHADFDFGSGEWTLEFWLNPNSVSGFQNFVRKSTTTNFAPFTMALDGNKLRTRCSQTGSSWQVDQTSSIAVATSTLVHVAAVRDAANVFRQYVGGVQSGNTTFGAGALMTNASAVYMGALSDDSAGYNGHIVAWRATKGQCLYPGGTTFTPPTLTGLTALNSQLRVRLEAQRDGLSSWQEHDITVPRSGYGFSYGDWYGG